MNQPILALDVAQHIPDFRARVHSLTAGDSIIGDEQSSFNDAQLALVEVLCVSIYYQVSEALLERLPRLKKIFVLGTSTKKLPIDYCARNHIAVFAVTEYCDDETAEWVMMEMLSYFRGQNRSLVGKKLGIVGVGAVGKKVIERALPFHMEIVYNARHHHPDLEARQVHLQDKVELFSSCDVISLHTPSHTQWLSRQELDGLKKNAVLINTCFGRMSREHDLEDFLKTRSDVVVIMDAIAQKAYPELISKAVDAKNSAYETIDSEQRLITKFFLNLKNNYR